MQPTKSKLTANGVRRAWQAPALVELPIRRKTRSAAANQQQAAGAQTSGEIDRAEPASPAAPEAKFGFSMEWAFPLSARWEK
jgi:hypothetical protein